MIWRPRRFLGKIYSSNLLVIYSKKGDTAYFCLYDGLKSRLWASDELNDIWQRVTAQGCHREGSRATGDWQATNTSKKITKKWPAGKHERNYIVSRLQRKYLEKYSSTRENWLHSRNVLAILQLWFGLAVATPVNHGRAELSDPKIVSWLVTAWHDRKRMFCH